MQDRLFDRLSADPEYDEDHDPYEEVRLAGARLASEFDIDPERAADMILSFGSERAAHRALTRRWLLDQPESRREAA